MKKSRSEDQKKNQMVLNLEFISSPPEISNRVIGVGEAFGIGIDSSKEFTIFKNLVLKYNDEDLIYVSGDSGSGKSCFIQLFAANERKRGRKVMHFGSVEPSSEEILINGVGSNLNEASRILSVVGLNEAFVMLRRYGELSEGQKYRYLLAKMIEANADVYLVDEFGATLDREMAKVLAYAFQKWARRVHKQVVIATTHHDLLEDFNPDIFIYKGFGEKTQIVFYDVQPRVFSLLNGMEIKEASKEDYNVLHQFHYIAGKPAFVRKRYKLLWEKKVIAVVVYSSPFASCRGRNMALPQYKRNMKKLNAEVIRLSRVIIHPKFRGVGLAHQFIRQCNIATGFKVVEVLAAMPKYNPVFEKAGMTNVCETQPNKNQINLVNFIKVHGGDPRMLFSKIERTHFMTKLNAQELTGLLDLLWKDAHGMLGIVKTRGHQLEKYLQEGEIDKVFKHALPKKMVYLYWVNPNFVEMAALEGEKDNGKTT